MLQCSHSFFAGETMNHRRAALNAAFPHTIPVFAGYCFLGMSYGILMKTSGFPFWYPMLTSMVVFAGSMEFMLVNLLLGAFDLVHAFALTLMINARHLFYGLSMLEPYKGLDRKGYLIFGLTDETFSVNCATDAPEGIDKGQFYFFITLLNQSYWVLGATLGGIFGLFLHFNTEGLDFVMTALFVVILLEHLLTTKDRRSAFSGMALSLASLILFGPDQFMLPAMVMILALLIFAARKEEVK